MLFSKARETPQLEGNETVPVDKYLGILMDDALSLQPNQRLVTAAFYPFDIVETFIYEGYRILRILL